MKQQARPLLRLTTAGSVDDGKSTLIGRLLLEAGAILDDQWQGLSQKGLEPDLALLTDGLKSEREQGITIDVAYKYFSTAERNYILADAPGHLQYTRNMVTAASRADAAILLVDARCGIVEQTRRHAYLLHLLRVEHLILAINKIDLVDYDEAAIAAIEAAFRSLPWNLPAHTSAQFYTVPISALKGDNCGASSAKTPWYRGPSLRALLDTIQPKPRNEAAAHLPVQLILREATGRRLAAGTLLSASLKLGQKVQVLPAGLNTEVAALWVHGTAATRAEAGEAVAVALAAEVDLERGQLLVAEEARVTRGSGLRAQLVWFDDEPSLAGQRYLLRLGTQTARATIDTIEHRLDLTSLAPVGASELTTNAIATVRLSLSRVLYGQPFAQDKEQGSFILIDPESYRTVAAGMILELSPERSTGLASGGRRPAALTVQAYDPESAVIPSTVPLPRGFFQANDLGRQQRLCELLLDAGWSVQLEPGPEAELLACSLRR